MMYMHWVKTASLTAVVEMSRLLHSPISEPALAEEASDSSLLNTCVCMCSVCVECRKGSKLQVFVCVTVCVQTDVVPNNTEVYIVATENHMSIYYLPQTIRL